MIKETIGFLIAAYAISLLSLLGCGDDNRSYPTEILVSGPSTPTPVPQKIDEPAPSPTPPPSPTPCSRHKHNKHCSGGKND